MFKIAILSQYPISKFKSELNLSNIEPEHPYPWVKNLADGLKNLGNVEVHIVSKSDIINKNICLQKDGITYHFVPNPSKILRFLSCFQIDTNRMLNELDKINPDIVHGQGGGFYGYYALKYSRNAVITLHGLAGKFFKAARLSDQISNIYNWIILLFLENYCIVKANNIISINPWVSELLKRKKYMGKIWNIPNAISEDYFQDIKINYKNKNLLFVGSILPRKGVLHIVKALKEITYYKLFLIYQYVDKKYLNEIKMFIEENDLKDRVTFVGSCDSKQIFEIMKKSCCLVLPSKMETAPMVISEAMATGLPCIATNVGGIKYMIDDGLTGYVIPKNDAKIFSEKIQKLTKSPNQYLKMSTDCRNRAEKKFSIDIVSRKTYRLYKQILDIK